MLAVVNTVSQKSKSYIFPINHPLPPTIDPRTPPPITAVKALYSYDFDKVKKPGSSQTEVRGFTLEQRPSKKTHC